VCTHSPIEAADSALGEHLPGDLYPLAQFVDEPVGAVPFYLSAMIKSEIICDSIGRHGQRITSFVCTYPRFIHSEVMTHRVFSRNAASSRAIPINKMIDEIKKCPARPVHWGRNQKGMQAHEALSREEATRAIALWDAAAKANIKIVQEMIDLGVHKQTANRLLEPFAHMVTLITATDFHNFFSLRADADAQPEFQVLAFTALDAYLNGTPKPLAPGEWHIPFGDRMPEGLELAERLKIAVARAARVSYKTFEGEINPVEDYRLHDRLAEGGHWSPFEHVAQCLETRERSGNFLGWGQYRKQFAGENRLGVNLREIAKGRKAFEWEEFHASLAE
jgi:thymidylate synthase ThyX